MTDTFRRCERREIERTETGWRLWFVHPQWGGYCAKACAEFCIVSGCSSVPTPPGCFDVTVWHDGEFPTHLDEHDGREPRHLHYCDALQLVRMGLDVYEAQLAHQTADDGRPVMPEVGELAEYRDRIEAMISCDRGEEKG